HHLRWKIEDRIDEHAPLDDLIVEPTLLGGNGGGESRRSRADDEEIANGHLLILHFLSLLPFPGRPPSFLPIQPFLPHTPLPVLPIPPLQPILPIPPLIRSRAPLVGNLA